jgi:hypothetical protein
MACGAGAWYKNDVFGLLDGNLIQSLLVGRGHVFGTRLLAALKVEGIGIVADQQEQEPVT